VKVWYSRTRGQNLLFEVNKLGDRGEGKFMKISVQTDVDQSGEGDSQSKED